MRHRGKPSILLDLLGFLAVAAFEALLLFGLIAGRWPQ